MLVINFGSSCLLQDRPHLTCNIKFLYQLEGSVRKFGPCILFWTPDKVYFLDTVFRRLEKNWKFLKFLFHLEILLFLNLFKELKLLYVGDQNARHCHQHLKLVMITFYLKNPSPTSTWLKNGVKMYQNRVSEVSHCQVPT